MDWTWLQEAQLRHRAPTLAAHAGGRTQSSRSVRIDGESAAGERARSASCRHACGSHRRWMACSQGPRVTGDGFMDRLTCSRWIQSPFRPRASRFERLTRQRNKLLERFGTPTGAGCDAIEADMAGEAVGDCRCTARNAIIRLSATQQAMLCRMTLFPAFSAVRIEGETRGVAWKRSTATAGGRTFISAQLV